MKTQTTMSRQRPGVSERRKANAHPRVVPPVGTPFLFQPASLDIHRLIAEEGRRKRK